MGCRFHKIALAVMYYLVLLKRLIMIFLQITGVAGEIRAATTHLTREVLVMAIREVMVIKGHGREDHQTTRVGTTRQTKVGTPRPVIMGMHPTTGVRVPMTLATIMDRVMVVGP